MKRVYVKNGVVDSIELNITDLSTQQGSYVAEDAVEVFAGYSDSNGVLRPLRLQSPQAMR